MLMMYLSLLDTQEEKCKFEELYNVYAKIMHLRAKEILKDDALAEDVVHEAFLKIIHNFHKIKEVKCPQTKRYIVIVVESTSIDIYRKERKKKFVPWDESVELHQFQGIEQLGDMTEVEKAMLELPLIYSNIFMMKYGLGYTNHEIAKRLHITESALKNRITRGKALLLDILKEKEVHVGGQNGNH